MKSPTYCVKAKEYTLAHCLLAPLKKFPSSDANPVQSPLAELCAPCVPSGTWGKHPHSAVPQNRPRPLFAPRKPRVAGFRPRWGNDPPSPGQRPVWATQGQVWQKRKKTAQPGKQPPAQMENTPAFDLPPGERFPQKISSGERCEKRAGERPGVAGGVPCRVTSPGRAERDRIFARRQFPHFPGSVWRPWGHDRGQNDIVKIS